MPPRPPCAIPRCAPPGRRPWCSRRPGTCSVTVVVGQIRSTAVDILRSPGMSYRDASDAVRAAAQDEEDA